MKRYLLLLLCGCLGAGMVAAVDTVTRVFTLDHVSVSEASSAVQPLLSENGSLTLQPSRSRMTVQDVPGVVDRVTELVEDMDRAPGRYQIRVDLLKGSKEAFSSAEPPAPVDPRLKRMFNFPGFRHLANTTLEGEVGSTAEAELGSDYEISFQPTMIEYSADTPWGAPDPGDRINLRHLVLKKIGVDSKGLRSTTVLLQTSMLLSTNQKVYVGAGKSEDADDGLVLIVHALATGVR